jgi:uncharacterized membrane protein YvlD (DUF360 family)
VADTVGKALVIAAIGLPVMLVVIGLFTLVAKALVVLFPSNGEHEQGSKGK